MSTLNCEFKGVPEDCIREGIYKSKVGTIEGYAYREDEVFNSLPDRENSPKLAFHALWDSINRSTYPWSMNPWVWGLYYRIIKKEGR